MASNLIYVDLSTGKAARDVTGGNFVFPDFVAGGSVTYAMRFLEYANGYLEKDQRIARIRVSLGPKDAPPHSGRYKLSLQGVRTGFLDHGATAKQVETALNAISTIGVVHCDSVPGGILIRRENGQELELSVVTNTLYPVSFGNVYAARVGTEWVYELRFQQAPYAFSDSASRILPDAPVIKTLQEGGRDISGTVIWNEIQSLFVPPTFRGTYQLRRNFGKTDLLDVTSTMEQIQTALNKMLLLEGSVAVTNPTNNAAHIEFKGGLGGTNVEPLIVQVYAAPPGDYTFTLDLNTAELRAALRASEKLTVPIEAEADFYVNPEDQQAGTITRKLWSSSVTVLRPLIFPELATVRNIDWLTPPAPIDYTPYTPDQVITGQQHYVTSFGNGVSKIFQIAHNLNTDDISGLTVRENAANGQIIKDFVARVDSPNSVTLTFSDAPASNALSVVITVAGPISAFQAHTHTINQIVNLGSQLDDLGSKVAYLMSLVPKAVFAPAITGGTAVNTVASFGEILPDASLQDSPLSISSQVIPSVGQKPAEAVPGTALQEQIARDSAALVALQAQFAAAKKDISDATAAGATVEEAKQIAASKSKAKTLITSLATPATGTLAEPVLWPAIRNNRMPALFNALYQTYVDVYGSPTLPSVTAYAGVVLQSTGIIIPSAGGRKSQNIPSGGYFASNGRHFYRVYAGSNNLWHAWEMDRELSRVAVSSHAFPAGGTLDFTWSTTALLLPDTFNTAVSNTDLFAQYQLQVIAIPVSTEMPVTLASVPLSFSEAKETRSFSLTIDRPGDGSSEAKTYLSNYGVKVAGTPLPWGDVIIVTALREFDTDNTSNAIGQLSLHIPASQLTISK